MSNRKLQTQIDRVLKKVVDGAHTFDQIWDNFYGGSSTAQKEKHEGELKKEIKKLQRLRDQIKTWQGDGLIKDKTKLDVNRRIIEERMEKFRMCEQQTKIKAFSKKGLAQDRANPKQRAKAAAQKWIQESISHLEKQSEELQADMESMKSGKRRKREGEDPRIIKLKHKVSRHEYHVKMLERVLRAADNDSISHEILTALKDNVEYYVEFNQDPDFFEDEEMYEALNLTSAAAAAPAVSGTLLRAKELDGKHGAAKVGRNSGHSHTSKEYASGIRPKATLQISSTTSPANSTSDLTFPKSEKVVSSKSTITENASSRNVSSQSLNVTREIHTGDANRELARTTPLFSTIVKGSKMKQDRNQVPEPRSSADINRPQRVLLKRAAAVSQESTGTLTVSLGQRIDTTQKTSADRQESKSKGYSAMSQPDYIVKRNRDMNRAKKLKNMNGKLGALQAALLYMPEASNKSRTPERTQTEQNHTGYSAWTTALNAPRNAVHVPESFPNALTSIFDIPETFNKFSVDTLFFIFYHRQRTHQHYLAANELKRRGWRFHKKYLTWFKRIGGPKRSTDEFEVGAYVYFDHVNVLDQNQGPSWCQRVKSDFVFEYRFLEN